MKLEHIRLFCKSRKSCAECKFSQGGLTGDCALNPINMVVNGCPLDAEGIINGYVESHSVRTRRSEFKKLFNNHTFDLEKMCVTQFDDKKDCPLNDPDLKDVTFTESMVCARCRDLFWNCEIDDNGDTHEPLLVSNKGEKFYVRSDKK